MLTDIKQSYLSSEAYKYKPNHCKHYFTRQNRNHIARNEYTRIIIITNEYINIPTDLLFFLRVGKIFVSFFFS